MDNFDSASTEAAEENLLPFSSQRIELKDSEAATRVHRLEIQNRLLISALESLTRENDRLLGEYKRLELLLTRILEKGR